MTEPTYTRNGDYEIPDLKLHSTGTIGFYGRQRLEYLKEYHPIIFNNLVLSEQLFSHLLAVEETAKHRMDTLTQQMQQLRGIDNALKSTDLMRWVGEMNNIRASAREIVLHEIVYA